MQLPLALSVAALGVKAVRKRNGERRELTGDSAADRLRRTRRLEQKRAYQHANLDKKRAWYHRTKEARRHLIRAYDRRSYLKTRDKRRARNKIWRTANQLRLKHYNWVRSLKDWGLTPEDYDRILKEQNGGCAICHNLCKSGRRLSVDHCHRTGRLRGLLCGNCNRGLGYFNDSEELLFSAANYLKAWRH